MLQTFIKLHNDAVKRDMDFLAKVYSTSIGKIAEEKYPKSFLSFRKIVENKFKDFKNE